MRKAIAFLLVAFVCLAGVMAGGAGESDTYKIGFIGPLTGDNANYGIRCSNAARLAIDEINAEGGINGKMLTLIAEDSEGTVDRALSSYEKLAYTDNVVAIIGPVFTSPALAVAQRCQEDGIVMISPSATHKDVTAQPATNPDGLNYVFRTVPSDALQSEVAGHYFYEVLGYRKLASLYAMNDYSQGLAVGMKETFEALGGEVVAEETCMVGDKDFRTQLTNIREAVSRLHSLVSMFRSSPVTDSPIRRSTTLRLTSPMVLSMSDRHRLKHQRSLLISRLRMLLRTMVIARIHSLRTAMTRHTSFAMRSRGRVRMTGLLSAMRLQLPMTSRARTAS